VLHGRSISRLRAQDVGAEHAQQDPTCRRGGSVLQGHSEGNKGQAPASFPTRKSALEVGHSLGVSAVQWLPGAAFSGGQLTRVTFLEMNLLWQLGFSAILVGRDRQVMCPED